MTAKLVTSNRLDGAWWPSSDDITVELPPLVKAVATRFGWIRSVLLSSQDWTPPPADWTLAALRSPRVHCSNRHQRHVVSLVRHDGRHIRLLLIPPSEDPDVSRTAMHYASKADNRWTAAETLLAARSDPRAGKAKG
jgi:hypothetical protein